jgi:hypothetical protein
MKQHGLRQVNRSARSVLDKLVEGLDELGASRKIDNARGAFMAVCVERVEHTAHGAIFSIAHYFEQRGDLVPDPDLTVLRAANGDFYPLTYQDALTYRRAVEFGEDGSIRLNKAQQADLAHFVGDWMKNVRDQQGL